jgi:hypothetical protein
VLKEMAMPKGKGMELEIEMGPESEGSEEMGAEEEMAEAPDMSMFSDEDLLKEVKARGLV